MDLRERFALNLTEAPPVCQKPVGHLLKPVFPSWKAGFPVSGTKGHPIRSKGKVAILEGKAGHLDESQRGMIAARLADMARGRPESNSPIGLFTHTQSEAAALLNVGTTSPASS